MGFQEYVVGNKWLTRPEFLEVLAEQCNESVGYQGVDSDGFQVLDRKTEEPAWTTMRRPPFGEVLSRIPRICELVLKRANVKSMAKLAERWHRDLIREMECIGNYSPEIRCASNLYTRHLEKKIVARYVVTSKRVNSTRTLIGKSEKIALLEGSSGFCLAMAVAHQFKSTCSIISSNGLLNSEYLHNPCIAKSFANFHVVGGRADFDVSTHAPDHAGVYGHDAQQQFESDMERDPGATTLVVPCSGILPDEGPLATSGDVQGLKNSVIRSAMEIGVHQIIFIVDYSKMLPTHIKDYGVAVFAASNWKKLITEHGSRISIVTTPPPALRRALASKNVHPCHRKKLSDSFPGVSFSSDDHEYSKVAEQFHSLFQAGIGFYEALHVEPEGVDPPFSAGVKNLAVPVGA